MQKKILTLAKRGQSAPASPIRALVPLSDAAKKRGIHIYHLNIGDPDFPLPDKISESLQMLSKDIKRIPYPAFRGQQGLISAWKTYFNTIGVKIPLENDDMIITAGASDAMVLATAVITDPGDEILVFEPYYAPYFTYGQFMSVKLTPVALDKKNNYHLPSKKDIVAKITSKTKAIFFTNPNNPTGTVFTRSEMQLILDIAKEHNLFVVSDETYRGMVFERKESLSLLHLAKDDDLERIIVTDSLSKRLNVCGARMGIVLSKNKEFIDAAFRFTQGRPYAAYIEQEIVTDMLADCSEYVTWLSEEYQKRRDAFIDTLEPLLGQPLQRPEGAFYTMLQLPIDNATKFARWLLTDFEEEKETVMVSPGEGFYATPGKGSNEVRIAYVLNEKDLKKAAVLLAKAVKIYNNTKI